MIRTAEPVAPASTGLRAALGLAVAGAVCGAVGPVLHVVDDTAPPAFTAWPLLALLALLPVAVATYYYARGRATTGAAVLVPLGAFAVCRFLVDLAIALDPVGVSRPELLRVTTLAAPEPAAGLWVLLAGHVLTAAAAVVAVSRLETEGGRGGRFGLATAAAVVAVAGLLSPPFASLDPFLRAGSVLDGPGPALVGGLLLLVAVPVATLLAASSADDDVRTGGLLGVALTLPALVAPGLAAVAVVDEIFLGVGAVTVMIGAAGLVFAALLPEHVLKEREGALPGLRRLNLVVAVLGLAAGAFLLVGALTPHLSVPAGLSAPTDYAARLLWPAAAFTLLALAPKARPAFIAATAAIPLAAGLSLDAVFAATQVATVLPGPGVWSTTVGVVLAIAAVITAVVAGAAERDEEDVTTTSPSLPLIAVALIAGLVAVGAFAMPVVRAPDLTPITALGLRVGSWGLLIALAGVLAAIGLALASRPVKGAALLLGAAGVTLTRALEYPLTASRAADTSPGPGLWLAVAATVALVIAAAVRTAR
ncbi:hypothetical protein AB0A74_09180 [Saccharothrix sp. NPDC042600]|uniref:hypothetical protein n=1 Tax=Saccharothrix TaxID=2071 RepID=UPI0033FC0120|nr:hypothetical protein GCM10017745_13470 [Saccharothrix mutabilis subsp. capreolus]